jgi:hypothetical protein
MLDEFVPPASAGRADFDDEIRSALDVLAGEYPAPCLTDEEQVGLNDVEV